MWNVISALHYLSALFGFYTCHSHLLHQNVCAHKSLPWVGFVSHSVICRMRHPGMRLAPSSKPEGGTADISAQAYRGYCQMHRCGSPCGFWQRTGRERSRGWEEERERDKCWLSGFWGGLASPPWAHVPVPDSLLHSDWFSAGFSFIHTFIQHTSYFAVKRMKLKQMVIFVWYFVLGDTGLA